MKSWREKAKAYPEKREANPEEMKCVAVHEEVPEEDVTVKTIRALKERYGDGHIAVGSRREPKKWSQGSGGSRKELAAAWRGMTRRVIPARRKGHCHQRQGMDKAVSRTQK
jgi:hypothetical protein